MRGVARWSVLLVSLAALPTAGRAASEPVAVAAPSVELVTQTPTVRRGGTFEVGVRLHEVPEDGSVDLILHGRVRSRSELATSMDGKGLRTQIYNVTTPIASLPAAADGTRRLSLSLDPVVAGGVALTSAGAYPVEIEARDAAGTPLSTLITHLLVRPDPADESPPLAVAVVATVDAPPALQPDGTIRLAVDAVRGAAELAAALTANSDTPATLAIRPETIDALTAGTDPALAAVLDLLRVAAAGRAVVSLPYVDVSPDALVDAGLDDELDHQLESGRLVLANALGVDPGVATWLAGPTLDLPGLRALQVAGVRHLVVAPDRLQPLRTGVLSLSLAQPLLVSSDLEPPVDVIVLDAKLTDRLGTALSPGLEVSRLLAELAVLWFEQPGIARAVVVPVDTSVRGAVVQGLLVGLDASGLFQATELDDVFATASPLRQPGGGRVDRALVPDDDRRVSRSLIGEVRATRDLLTSFTTLVGVDTPEVASATSQLLLATAADLRSSERKAHADAAREAMGAVTDAVSAPPRESITLTAREGNVPLTLRNDAGLPVNVVVHLRSTKLAFPNGATIAITLTDPTTRLNIPVRARASGTFPLEVTVSSPDGVLTLATVDYSVQSTAVSGVGVVLSLGAACFLAVWWARHWRRTRRSGKLVTTQHSTHAASVGSGTTPDTDGAQSL